jgi:hypothetical protein
VLNLLHVLKNSLLEETLAAAPLPTLHGLFLARAAALVLRPDAMPMHPILVTVSRGPQVAWKGILCCISIERNADGPALWLVAVFQFATADGLGGFASVFPALQQRDPAPSHGAALV